MQPIKMNEDYVSFFEKKLSSEQEIGLWELICRVFKYNSPNDKSQISLHGKILLDSVYQNICQRSSDEVLLCWRNLGIDHKAAKYYMDFFALEYKGNVYPYIIPEDSATIILWYKDMNLEMIGEYFGIFTYVWLYGFFRPKEIFIIPDYRDVKNLLDDFYNKYDVFSYNITIGTVITLILLYEDKKRQSNGLFEPDIPFANSKLHRNTEWIIKLKNSPVGG